MFKVHRGHCQQCRRDVGAVKPKIKFTFLEKELAGLKIHSWDLNQIWKEEDLYDFPAANTALPSGAAESKVQYCTARVGCSLPHQQSRSETPTDHRVSEKPLWRPQVRQCFLNKQGCGPWTSIISITRELVRNGGPIESEKWTFTKPSGNSMYLRLSVLDYLTVVVSEWHPEWPRQTC